MQNIDIIHCESEWIDISSSMIESITQFTEEISSQQKRFE